MKIRKRVFIAGPYSSAERPFDVLENIHKGVDAFHELLKLGLAPYCPWLDSLSVISRGLLDVKIYQENSMAWLVKADAVLLLEGWEKSKGTRKEVAIANKSQIPIFYSIKEIALWDAYCKRKAAEKGCTNSEIANFLIKRDKTRTERRKHG
jgi:hypothetical protein